jgi:uncharacterized protein YndB with AHSA1/START domain
MKELWTHESIAIAAPATKVWEMLTDPALTRQYMFGCEALSDWKVGDPLLWQGEHEGKKMVFVKGSVVAFDAPRSLRYTVFDPNSTIPDVPENYLEVRCTLTEDGGTTRLDIDTGDFARVANGQARYDDTVQNGGGELLQKMKAVAESLPS